MSLRIRALATLTLISLSGAAVSADDLVRQMIRADEAIAKYGVTGQGVTIAILDRGIDWRHPDFINPGGTTRIKFLLDMSGQQGCGPNGRGTPQPVEYTAAQINAALQGGAPLGTRDAVGHGTATAGLAAGNGRAFAGGKYAGLAPQADLIIVKLTSEGAPAHGNEPAESAFQGCIDEALDWVDGRIGNTPAVALINSGTQWGPIDGTSAVSRKIDAVFGSSRPGRVYVAASGDEGGLPNHSGGAYDQSSDTAVSLFKASTDTTYMQAWYTGALPAQVTITLDDGTTVGPVLPGTSVTQGGISIFHYLPGQEFHPWRSTSGDRAVWIRVVGHSGGGSFKIRGQLAGTGRFDVYGDALGPDLTPIVTFRDHLVPGRLTDYASTRSAVVAGVSVVRTSWTDVDGFPRSITHEGSVGGLWVKSSGGPTRDGRLPGVDIVAPGHNAFAAYASNSYWRTHRSNLVHDGGGWYGRAGATSASAPITVGAIALMLQLAPRLDAGRIRDILRATADSDGVIGTTPNVDWGFGRLNLLKALDAAAAPAITTQPAPQTIEYGRTAVVSVAASGHGLTYQWYRGNAGVTADPIAGATSNSYTTPALISNSRYWVRVANAFGGLVDSNVASVLVAFTDSVLTAGVMTIKAAHIVQLRARIDALRRRYSLPEQPFTDPTIVAAGTTVKASHILEMRNALHEVYVAAGLAAPSYGTSPGAGVAVVVADIAELRSAVHAIE